MNDLHNSPHSHEKEFLLPHGTKLRHKRTEIEEHPKKADTTIHHHHMEIVP